MYVDHKTIVHNFKIQRTDFTAFYNNHIRVVTLYRRNDKSDVYPSDYVGNINVAMDVVPGQTITPEQKAHIEDYAKAYLLGLNQGRDSIQQKFKDILGLRN